MSKVEWVYKDDKNKWGILVEPDWQIGPKESGLQNYVKGCRYVVVEIKETWFETQYHSSTSGEKND